jgi:hypothetical protein
MSSQPLEETTMTIGYDKPLYVLPFDHRATFASTTSSSRLPPAHANIDRTIAEYAAGIWNAEPCPVPWRSVRGRQ